jgi:Short C-terminal domain/Phospholipase_D-nuclease N-terminal
VHVAKGVAVTGYPLLDLFLTMMWFFLWIVWIFLLIRVFTDLFRSHDIGGWAKAGWIVLVILLPFLGVFIYLIARGHEMAAHDQRAAEAQDKAFKQYVQQAAGTPSSNAAELSNLADLHDRGVLTDSEFEAQKAKILG